MVKHQRRSHQRGGAAHSSELDDGDTSDSDIGESPSTPRLSASQVQWPQEMHLPLNSMHHSQVLHRAHSFAEFGHQGQTYGLPYNHRHSISESPHEYPHPSTIHEQHHPQNIIQRPAVHQHTYYVPEQNNPGVATMNTNPIQSYLARPMPERQISYTGQPMPGSLESSPTTYSAPSSGRSPPPPEMYYSHQPMQTSPYPVHNQSPIEQLPMVQYQQHPQQVVQSPQQPIVNASPIVTEVQQQYQQQSPQEHHWYATAPYQEPVEVISALNSYTAAGIYDPWQAKLEAFDDPSIQLPSARIENL
jgi:hypothetical protein